MRYGSIASGIFCAFMLVSCARYTHIEMPHFTTKAYSISLIKDSIIETNILYISHVDSSYTLALFNTFGVPLAHKSFKNGKFSNMKFLQPKRYYNPLFFNMLKLAKSGEKEGEFYIQDFLIKAKEIEDIYE